MAAGSRFARQGVRVLLAVVLGAASCSALPSSLSLQRPGTPVRRSAPSNPGAQACGHRGLTAAAGARGAGMRLRGGADVMASAAMNPELAKQMLNSGMISQPRKIGFALIAVGIILSFLGFMLFLNKTLIGTGNIFVVAGVVLAVGWKKSKDFMFQRQRARGSTIFLFGLYLVLRGWARLGVLVEFFGILNLFGNFLPSLVNLIKKLPVVGPVLAPVMESPVFEKCMGYASKMAAPTTAAAVDGTAPPPGAGAPPPGAGAPQSGSKADGGYDWAAALKKGQQFVSGYTKSGQAPPASEAAGAGAPPYGGAGAPPYGGAPPGYGGPQAYGAAPQGPGYGGGPPSYQAPRGQGQPPGYGYGGPPPGPGGGGPPGGYGGYPPGAGAPQGSAPPLRQQQQQQPQRKKTWNEIQKEQLERMSKEMDQQGNTRPPAGGGWGTPPGYGNNKPPGY